MSIMKKVVVIGGTGLIGSKAVKLLQDAGHEAVVASSRNGINAYTGEGLEAALTGADAVIDVSNMMSFDKDVITDFFRTSSRNLTSAEQAAGVRHHVALSIVNADQLAANPYMAGRGGRILRSGLYHRPGNAVPRIHRNPGWRLCSRRGGQGAGYRLSADRGQ